MGRYQRFSLGDTVYLYHPVLVPGTTKKLKRPWVGPYYIVEKVSPLHVKLRRKSDSKLVVNKIHVNRLKRAVIRPDQPDDTRPPAGIDAVPPAVLDDSEIPDDNFDNTQTHAQTDLTTDENSQTMDGNSQSQTDNDVYEIEKILRKKFTNGSWYYRVKWYTFPSSSNSWVKFDDLTQACKDLVSQTHDKIPTDGKSQRKR